MLLKEVNGYHKYLGCPYLQDNNFEFPRGAIALNKIGRLCAETVRAKPTINDTCFMLNTWQTHLISC